jgi:hypothetical protein
MGAAVTRSMELAGVRIEERPGLPPAHCTVYVTGSWLVPLYSGPFAGRPTRGEVQERTGDDITRLLVSSALFDAIARGAERRFGGATRKAEG